jgi:iron complex outermembrane receptor protein
MKNLGRSIADVDTKNVGLFIKSKKSMGKLDVEVGARYDDTSIDVQSTAKDNDYTALSANVFAIYKADDETKYFAGVGKSSRVPDARELYNTKPKETTLNGNPNLEQTTNYELDIGIEKYYDDGTVKVKTFYSKLKDYIYYNSNKALKGVNNFENIDANIYGVELSGSYYASDRVTLDAGVSYKKGEKDTLPTGQSDRDLAEITPFKLNASVAYDYDEQGDVMLSVVAADKWDSIDSDNGEQALAGYAVLNLKTTREFDNGIEFTAGVDNMLDKTYASTNTYNDLILITDGADNTILMNEPGRYMYVNAKYKF